MSPSQPGSGSKSTGGVPSLPSVLAPLAGYRYAKSINDQELMRTEAMKFQAKLRDERIKLTESHNKEIRGLEGKLAEANTNLEVAKAKSGAKEDIYKRGYTALQSQLNRVTSKLIDLGIEKEIADGVGSKTGRYIEMWEQNTGNKFEDLSDADQDKILRLAAEKPLMEAKAMIANQGIQGGLEPTQDDISNIAAGGRPELPDTPKTPNPPTNADAAIVNNFIANNDLDGAIAYMQKQQELKSPGSKSSTSGAGSSKTKTEKDDIATNNVLSAIVSNIWAPEKTDVPFGFGKWKDQEGGQAPASDEMWQLATDLMVELGRTDTLPNDIRTRIDGMVKKANEELEILDRTYPDQEMFDQGDGGRMMFNRGVSEKDKSAARRYAPVKIFFESPEGQAFMGWLNRSASSRYYDRIPLRPTAPAQSSDSSATDAEWSGDTLKRSEPAETTPTQRIASTSEAHRMITDGLGVSENEWATIGGQLYRILEFHKTSNPQVPFMVRARAYTREMRRGSMRWKTAYVWLTPDQLDGLQKTEMPEDVRAMIAQNQMP